MGDKVSRRSAEKVVAVSRTCGVANSRPFTLIAGPCALESEAMVMDTAGHLLELCNELEIPLIFKTSFDKANRSSSSSKRGAGLDVAIDVFDKLRRTLGVLVLTDIHESYQVSQVAPHVDVLQIPAFLCRQSDLLNAAAGSGATVNVKKGQFLSPYEVNNIIDKLETFGCKKILLTERGTSFGYNNLVVDMRSLPIMASRGYPVIMDATHAVQQPGGLGKTSGGDRKFVALLARAAVSIGVAGVFIETHPDPDRAYSDGPNMVPLARMREVLEDLKRFDQLAKANPLPQID